MRSVDGAVLVMIVIPSMFCGLLENKRLPPKWCAEYLRAFYTTADSFHACLPSGFCPAGGMGLAFLGEHSSRTMLGCYLLCPAPASPGFYRYPPAVCIPSTTAALLRLRIFYFLPFSCRNATWAAERTRCAVLT